MHLQDHNKLEKPTLQNNFREPSSRRNNTIPIFVRFLAMVAAMIFLASKKIITED